VFTIFIYSNSRAQERSILEVVPEGSVACLKVDNLRVLDSKLSNLINSFNIPDARNMDIAGIIGKITGSGVTNLMDMEDAGFDVRGGAYIFWTKLAPKRFSIAIRVNSVERAKEAVYSSIGGVNKKYKDITYAQVDTSAAWVFLDDLFVYSKNKSAIMDAIETYLKDKPSILADEKYSSSIDSLRNGNFSGYVDLEKIITTFLPLLRVQAEKAKENISKQMQQQQQQQANAPGMNVDPSKILGAEMDMGLWILQQLSSYTFSIGIEDDAVWLNNSLKFKSESPVLDFMKIRPRRLELTRYLPKDIFMAGGATIDRDIIGKLNSIMFDVMVKPMMLDKMSEGEVYALHKKYEDAMSDILSCFGDEIAFAVSLRSDKAMPRLVYIFEVDDEEKIGETIGNLDYIMEMSKPFYDAFGMDFQMTQGPSQKYTGIQIESFQMNMSQMTNLPPQAAAMYPENTFLWYAIVDGKMIYTMSQSAETIKDSIDALKGRKPRLKDSQGFQDIDIRLPSESNLVAYMSPMGMLSYSMGMMAGQMGAATPSSSSNMGNITPRIGFASTTKIDKDGVRNYVYVLVDEVRELIKTGIKINKQIQEQKQVQRQMQEQEPQKPRRVPNNLEIPEPD
jgi:hypothetical protein